jgi:hypothetical protein
MKREGDMRTDRAVELLQEERLTEKQEIAEAKARVIVDRVKALHVVQYEHGVVVQVTKRLGDRDYTYVALRVVVGTASYWYVTGSAGRLSDLDFEEFLVNHDGFTDFKVLSASE